MAFSCLSAFRHDFSVASWRKASVTDSRPALSEEPLAGGGSVGAGSDTLRVPQPAETKQAAPRMRSTMAAPAREEWRWRCSSGIIRIGFLDGLHDTADGEA